MNSFSRVAVYAAPTATGRSAALHGPAESRCSWTSTGRLDADPQGSGKIDDARFLRHELTALVYHLVGGGGVPGARHRTRRRRDLLSARVFGASHVMGVEINPIIGARRHARTVPRLFRGLCESRVTTHVDDGRSFIRRAREVRCLRRRSSTRGRDRASPIRHREFALHGGSVRDSSTISARRSTDDHALGLRRTGRVPGAVAAERRGLDPAQHWRSSSSTASRPSC